MQRVHRPFKGQKEKINAHDKNRRWFNFFFPPENRPYLLSMSVCGGSGNRIGKKSTGHKQWPTCGHRPGTAGVPHAACTQNTLACETMWPARRPDSHTLTPNQHPDISTIPDRISLTTVPRLRLRPPQSPPAARGPWGPCPHAVDFVPGTASGFASRLRPRPFPLPERIDPPRGKKNSGIFFTVSPALDHFFEEGSQYPELQQH